MTSDGGKTWGTGLIDAPVASVPDALAASASGAMLALLDDGAIDQAVGAGTDTGWSRLAAPGAVAASAAGRRCQVTGLTGVAYNPSGTPLTAASCARPGVAGIFARSGNTWTAAGPSVPGGRQVQVLRLAGTPTGDVALLQTGTGGAAALFAAWTSGGTRWTVSPPLLARSQAVQASGTGSAGSVWVLLGDGRAETIAAPGAAWRGMPAPPAGTAALASLPGGTFDALAASVGKLTVYQLSTADACGPGLRPSACRSSTVPPADRPLIVAQSRARPECLNLTLGRNGYNSRICRTAGDLIAVCVAITPPVFRGFGIGVTGVAPAGARPGGGAEYAARMLRLWPAMPVRAPGRRGGLFHDHGLFTALFAGNNP